MDDVRPEVGQRIERLVSTLSGALSAVRSWSERQCAEWRLLRVLAALSESPPADLEALAAVLDGRSELPPGLRRALEECRERLRSLDEAVAARDRMAAVAEELAASDDLREIRRTLGGLTGDAPLRRQLAPDAASVLAVAWTAFVQDDVADLRNWRHDNGKLFAQPVFAAARQSWRWIADQGRLPREAPARHRQRDYVAFTRALVAQPLANPSGVIADAVLAALAVHHGVTDEPEWTAATAGFRAYLVDAVDRARSGAPADFSLVGHCLPNFAPPVRVLTEDRRARRDELVRALRGQADALAGVWDERAALAAVPELAAGFREEVAERLAAASPPELTGAAEAESLAELVAAAGECDDAEMCRVAGQTLADYREAQAALMSGTIHFGQSEFEP